jgi:hypothetical protein
MEADFTYFRRRAREEREAAMKAPHAGARQAHVEMADRYDELAEAIAAHNQTLSRQSISAG